MYDDVDNDLLQLFEENNLELPANPFGAELRRRIEKERAGYSRIYWLLTALALIACIVATNFVIDGVTLLCGELTRVLQSAGEILLTPVGWSIAGVVALLSPALHRRVLSILS